jgi:SAM-dependent methyltransferase
VTTTDAPAPVSSAVEPAEDDRPMLEHDPEAFVGRVVQAVLGAQEVHAAYLGDRLGWYRALADHGPLTSVELAERTGTDERYAREWLEHQAACAWVAVDDPSAPSTERRFSLPDAHAEVLTDEDSLAFAAPFPRMVGGLGMHLERLVDAYRSGAGVPWSELGRDAREAQAAANRPLFLNGLGTDVFPSVPDLHERLSAGGRVADIGCGAGWSSIGIALAYPEAHIDGYDLDAPSVEMARANATQAGVADRVSFRQSDAATADGEPYDAVVAFECIHDLSDPVAVLTAMRRLAGSDGIVLVMDEGVGECFQGPADDIERMLYGFSLTCCLPDGRSHHPSAGTGTVMRPATLTAYATDAGFRSVEILDAELGAFRFYRLHGRPDLGGVIR